LVRQAVKIGHHRQGKPPEAIGGAINQFCVLQWLVVIEPIKDWVIFLFIELHLNGLKGLNIEYVVAIVKGRLLIVKRRESHSLEMTAVALFSAHHDPHGAPLRGIDRFNDLWYLIDESNGTSYVIESLHISDLLPGHRHVLEELVDGVRDVLEGPKIHALVLSEPL
jgi:hypothetical protein